MCAGGHGHRGARRASEKSRGDEKERRSNQRCHGRRAATSTGTPYSSSASESFTADRPRGAYLLSPFDNLLFDRVEAGVLFGFEHALEIYKRPHERVWGYYVLPLLDASDIVGRVDAKADRKAGTLRALAVHWQGRPRPRALREALERLAWRLGLPETEVVQGGV